MQNNNQDAQMDDAAPNQPGNNINSSIPGGNLEEAKQDQMDIDQDNQSQTIAAPQMVPGAPYFAQPNLGTVNLNKRVEPTVPHAKDLKELHEEYKQYKLLKKKDDMNSNEEAGTAAYVVSLKWVRKYLKFLLYDQFSQGVAEH